MAAAMHREHKLDTTDAIVYATARHRVAMLLTCDTYFAGLADVELLAKLRSACAQLFLPDTATKDAIRHQSP